MPGPCNNPSFLRASSWTQKCTIWLEDFKLCLLIVNIAQSSPCLYPELVTGDCLGLVHWFIPFLRLLQMTLALLCMPERPRFAAKSLSCPEPRHTNTPERLSPLQTAASAAYASGTKEEAVISVKWIHNVIYCFLKRDVGVTQPKAVWEGLM